MNVKIQGSGNGTYANTGSCVAVTNYLQHEDLERMKKGEEVQPFFNQFRDYVSAREVTFKIDNNKAKLSRTDAKFYVITVSPSEKELRCMGRTPQECAEALRRYIRQDVMRGGFISSHVQFSRKLCNGYTSGFSQFIPNRSGIVAYSSLFHITTCLKISTKNIYLSLRTHCLSSRLRYCCYK